MLIFPKQVEGNFLNFLTLGFHDFKYLLKSARHNKSLQEPTIWARLAEKSKGILTS